MKTCFIVEDHIFTTDGLKAAIASLNLQCVGSATSVAEAHTKIRIAKPDYILLDHTINDQTGLDLIELLHGIVPANRFVLVSQVSSKTVIKQYLDKGLEGFVAKTSGADELLKALFYRVKTPYFCPVFTEVMTADDPASVLTTREMEVCRHVALGNTNKEIAQSLVCSEFTIKSHKVSIMRKLGLTNSVEVGIWALKNKVI